MKIMSPEERLHRIEAEWHMEVTDTQNIKTKWFVESEKTYNNPYRESNLLTMVLNGFF